MIMTPDDDDVHKIVNVADIMMENYALRKELENVKLWNGISNCLLITVMIVLLYCVFK